MKKLKSRLIINTICFVTAIVFLFSFKAYVKTSFKQDDAAFHNQTRVVISNQKFKARFVKNEQPVYSSGNVIYAINNKSSQ